MPRSRSVSPRGSSDSFHLAPTCERSSSAHRSKLSGHQRQFASNSTSSTAFTSSGPHRKKDSEDIHKDSSSAPLASTAAEEAKGEETKKEEIIEEETKEEDDKDKKPSSEDDKKEAKKDPSATASSDKKKNGPCKVIPLSLPPVMCDVNDRPTVHQRRAEQAEVRARLARENEESANQERERGGSQTPGYGPQKAGSNYSAGAHGAQTAPGSDMDCARYQRPQATGGGGGAYGQGGQAGYAPGAYGQGSYGPKGQGAYEPGGAGNCPPGTYGPLSAQVPGCPPVDSGGAGGYGSQTNQAYGQASPYGNQGGAQPGYQMGGRYGEPYPSGRAGSQFDGQNRMQPSPFGGPQAQTTYPSQAGSQYAPGGTPGRGPGGVGGGGMGPQDEDSLQVNCICTVSQADSGPQGGAAGSQFNGQPPGGFPPAGYPGNQFGNSAGYAQRNQCVQSGQGGHTGGQGGFQQENRYNSGTMAGSKDGRDACGTGSVGSKDGRVSGGYPQANQQGGQTRGRPCSPGGGQVGRPPQVQQGNQKGQARCQQGAKGSQQGGQRNVQQSEQGATQLILQIDAGRMLLGQQSGPICIPCTLMPVGQFEGGPDDESVPTWTAQDSDNSASTDRCRQQSAQSKSAGQQGKTGGPSAPGVCKGPNTQEPRAFRPAPKGPGGNTQRFGGQPPGQQNICNQPATDFSSQNGSQRQPSAMTGYPQNAYDSSPGGAQGQCCPPFPPQGAGFMQGPGQQGRSVAQGAYKQGQDGVCAPQGNRSGNQQPVQGGFQQAPGGGMCPLPGGPQGMGPSQGYPQGPGGFQGKNVPQDPYQSAQGPYQGPRSGPGGGLCPPGMETGQGYQQGGGQCKGPAAPGRPSSGQGNLSPGEDACRPQYQGGTQQKMGQGQQRGPEPDGRSGNVSFQSGSQDQCFFQQGSGQYHGFAGGPQFGGPPIAGGSQNDSQQASTLAMCIQRCCNAATFNSGRLAHEDSSRGRHRLISSTGAPDCGAEGIEARHGKQRRSNGHSKGPMSRNDEDDLSSKSSCSRDASGKNVKESGKENDPSSGIVPSTCAYPICMVPCQPACCVMPCQSQCCPPPCCQPHSCCWPTPQPTCLCCMPTPTSNSQNGDPNAANGSFGKSGAANPSNDDVSASYGGRRPCCMRYGGSNHRKACRHTISRHSNRPLPVTSQSKENNSALT